MSEFSPWWTMNVVYDSAETNENFQNLSYLVYAPCPAKTDSWTVGTMHLLFLIYQNIRYCFLSFYLVSSDVALRDIY